MAFPFRGIIFHRMGLRFCVCEAALLLMSPAAAQRRNFLILNLLFEEQYKAFTLFHMKMLLIQ